jgi:hypothetical protein
MRGVVIDVHDYDWEVDQPLRRPTEHLIIYELHVGGFTRHASSGVKHPRHVFGVIEKIPYIWAGEIPKDSLGKVFRHTIIGISRPPSPYPSGVLPRRAWLVARGQ